MEHGAVAADGLAEAGLLNLEETYLRLGTACAGARAHTTPSFVACTSSTDHPICNFAVVKAVDGRSIQMLRDLALARFSFIAYELRSDEQVLEALAQGGFELQHELVAMIGEPSTTEGQPLQECGSAAERLAVARFMMGEFFSKQPRHFRAQVAEATSAAGSLRLCKMEIGGTLAAAAMLSEHAGVVGIYNVCVARRYRGRGMATAMLRSIAQEAGRKGMGLCLQCDRSLERWYADRGFSPAGRVSALRLQGNKTLL